jgi:hypothetical protein
MTVTKHNFIKKTPEPHKPRKVHVGAGVDPLVVKRLETLGIDIPSAIAQFLNETAGHYVCPTCNSLLKSLHKKVR